MKSRRAVSRSENGEQSPLGLNGEDEVRMLLRTAWTSEDAVVYSLDLPPVANRESCDNTPGSPGTPGTPGTLGEPRAVSREPKSQEQGWSKPRAETENLEPRAENQGSRAEVE